MTLLLHNFKRPVSLKIKGKYVIIKKKDFQDEEAILNQAPTCQTHVNKTNRKQIQTFLKPLGLKEKRRDR